MLPKITMSTKQIGTYLVGFILAYMFLWAIIMPFWGTIRCKEWDSDGKCSGIVPGFINPYFIFDEQVKAPCYQK